MLKVQTLKSVESEIAARKSRPGSYGDQTESEQIK